MRTPILSLLFIALAMFVLPNNANAQKAEKKYVKDLCNCIEKVDTTQALKQLEDAFDNCLAVASAVNRVELSDRFNKQNKYDTERLFIKALVNKAYYDCPKFLQLSNIINRGNDENEDLTGQTHDVPAECLMAHEGTFYYITNNNDTLYISRKGNLQYEGVLGKKMWLRSEVKWIDECTYVVTLLECNEPKSLPSFEMGEKLTVYLTNISGSRYNYFTQVDGVNYLSDMTKVSDDFYDPRK